MILIKIPSFVLQIRKYLFIYFNAYIRLLSLTTTIPAYKSPSRWGQDKHKVMDTTGIGGYSTKCMQWSRTRHRSSKLAHLEKYCSDKNQLLRFKKCTLSFNGTIMEISDSGLLTLNMEMGTSIWNKKHWSSSWGSFLAIFKMTCSLFRVTN